jgi:hypothetical protein
MRSSSGVCTPEKHQWANRTGIQVEHAHGNETNWFRGIKHPVLTIRQDHLRNTSLSHISNHSTETYRIFSPNRYTTTKVQKHRGQAHFRGLADPWALEEVASPPGVAVVSRHDCRQTAVTEMRRISGVPTLSTLWKSCI